MIRSRSQNITGKFSTGVYKCLKQCDQAWQRTSRDGDRPFPTYNARTVDSHSVRTLQLQSVHITYSNTNPATTRRSSKTKTNAPCYNLQAIPPNTSRAPSTVLHGAYNGNARPQSNLLVTWDCGAEADGTPQGGCARRSTTERGGGTGERSPRRPPPPPSKP